jgi:hypothetical protein
MKKYTIISFIFIALVGLLIYVNSDSSTTFDMFGIHITLYNAVWFMVFLFIFYLISIIYFAIIKYKTFAFEKNIKKDKLNLIKNIENKILFKDKILPVKILKECEEFVEMIEGLVIKPKKSEIFTFMEDVEKLQNGEVIDLSKYKFSSKNPWVIKNLENRIEKEDLSAAKDALKIESLKEKALFLLAKKAEVNEILANNYPIYKETILNNLESSRLKELIEKSDLKSDEYIEIAKTLYKKEENNPENVITLFENKIVPYVYLLIKYEMLDKAKELAHENDLKFFKYYLDLKEKNIKLDDFLDARYF